MSNYQTNQNLLRIFKNYETTIEKPWILKSRASAYSILVVEFGS